MPAALYPINYKKRITLSSLSLFIKDHCHLFAHNRQLLLPYPSVLFSLHYFHYHIPQRG